MTEESRTIEDDIRDAMAEHATEEVVEPVAEEPTPESVEEVEQVGRERDEHGRFKAKEPAEQTVPEMETPEVPVAEEAPAEEEPVNPDPYGLAPQHVGPALKEKWADLPPEVRKDIVDREKEVHKGFTKFDEERVFGKQVREVVKPYESFIKSLGAEPIQAVDYLIKTDYALRTAAPEQRKAMFLKAAKDYGIDLANDNAAPQADAPTVPSDPRVETLEHRLIRLEQEQNSAIEARREEDQRAINSQIESFASRPENAYFERVKPVMAILLQNGQADSLEKAYEMAVYADPETRALHLAAQREAEDRKRAAETRQRAEKARQASPSVTGAPGTTVPTPHANGSASLEDDIRSAMLAVNGRA